MPTTKKRINISVSPSMHKAITQLAKRDRVPQATKATELISRAIEYDEDEALNVLASERDIKEAKFFSHEEAWK